MKKITLNMEIDSYTERAVKKICRENGMSVEKFIEEAVFEKLEAEEVQKESFLTGDADEQADNEGADNILFDSDGDPCKKIH